MKSPVHLNALRAFEASARHQSFSAAAGELHVTPAAVGQLVRSLEEWLGSPLFIRATSGSARLVPTAAAERALPDIRSGFEQLRVGLERLQDATVQEPLTVTVSPAFAAKWLLPRIDGFLTAWPDMDLRLHTSLQSVDFPVQRIDIGVRYGAGQWAGLQAERMMDEELHAVCSPKMAEQHVLTHAADLGRFTLIHDMSLEGHAAFPTWEDWFARAGVRGVDARRGVRINNSAAVLQAAAEGQGVALARSVMVQEDLASGRLVRLFPEVALASPFSYFLIYRLGSLDLPRVAKFRDWIMAEVRRSR